MRQFNNPENLDYMISPPQEKKNRENKIVYSSEFQAMLDGLDEEDERSQSTKRKRRLGFEQVKALERIFEVDNKLEPERKVRIAEELGLQPRQVAIWFQNRRARWRTKQLEKDYGLLKSNYEALKLNYGNLAKEKESLIAELEGLRAKIGEENSDSSNQSVREEEAQTLESENNVSEQSCGKLEVTNLDYELGNHGNLLGYVGFEDGLSDNNCSGVINGDGNINPHLLRSSTSRYEGSSMDSSWMNNCFQLLDSRAFPGLPPKGYPDQFVKMEEHGGFRSEDSGSYIFSLVDQAPPLHWFHS